MTSLSIATVVKNGAATIGDCLESVRGQSVSAEHVVWDGGSTDDTLQIVRASSSARLVCGRDSGIYDAMNKVLRETTGEVIGLLNADDAYADESCLARVADAFRDPAVETCYGDLVYVNGADSRRVVRRWTAGAYSRRSFLWGWMPPHPTFFVRRSVYERHGAFDTRFGTSADYELMLRLLFRHGVSTVYIPKVLVKMRMGGASGSSLAARLRANRMDRKAWKENALDPYPWTILAKPLRKVVQFR